MRKQVMAGLAGLVLFGVMLFGAPRVVDRGQASVVPIQTWTIETSGSISATNGTTSFPTPLCLHWATGVFTAAATNGITVTLDSAAGSNYDSILYVIPGTSTTDFLEQPDAGALCLAEGDQLKIDWVNPSVVRANIRLGVSW